MKLRISTLILALLLFASGAFSQLPGIIVRPAGAAGPVILDPDGNGYTSATTAGFGNNDIANSEIPYKVIAPNSAEPTGDLVRGPSGAFTDIVKTFDGSGFYMSSNGTHIRCRLRIGGIVSGSKGYSILLDTDLKFGASGPSADPNFQAATTGTNGNPGFEYEIVLETNFRVAIYNVDGTSTPTLVQSYPIATNSQVSVAATTDGGNPDFFYDFYVPYAAMGLTASTPIRAIATTVMCPCPAIGGPKSDIYGFTSKDYMSDWISGIESQPPFTMDDLLPGGSGVGPICTAPPVVNNPIAPSATTVSGTWTKSNFSTITNAAINLYKNGTLIGSTTASSGGSWSVAVSGLANTDIITAKAQAIGESMCLSSNQVTVTNCSNSTHSATPVVTCSSLRGFEGTMAAGTSVRIYKLTTAGYALYADDATTTYLVTYPTSTTWRYDDINTQSGSACSGGAADILAGAYIITGTTAPNCASNPLSVCIGTGPAPATLTVSSALTQGATSITGNTSANAGLALWLNGYYIQSTTANASGAFTFTLASMLELNQPVEIRSVTAGSCAQTFTGTVSCYVAAPVINANGSNQVAVGSQLTGISNSGSGSTITVYNASTSAVIGTATVQADASWTLSSPLVAAGISYNARVTTSPCGTSAASNTVAAVTPTPTARCGSITGTINESATTVSGTVTTAVANTVVTLYADGISIGSVTTGTTSWTIPVNTTVNNTIYPGAVLTIGIQEASRTEIACAATTTVTCTPPAAPSFTPANTSISVGQSVTFTVTGSQSGIMYALRDNADALNMGESKFGDGATITLSSAVFNTPGTYTVRIKAISLSGGSCTSFGTATVTVTGVLPVTITEFTGRTISGVNRLNWTTSMEQYVTGFEIERSNNGREFQKIGYVAAVGNSNTLQHYSFDDRNAGASQSYYRLRITENQAGRSSYSKIVMLRSDKGIVITQFGPNPFQESIQLGINVDQDMPLTAALKDIAGRKIRSLAFSTKKGMNNIDIQGLGGLAKGTYSIEIMSGGERLEQKLLIKK